MTSPSDERGCSPLESWIQIALRSVPTEVMTDPSGETAMPSSWLGPNVSCSGSPFGNRCRHKWDFSSTSTLKYIHVPSGDHPAVEHLPRGPTNLPVELPSRGTRRQGSHTGR